MYFEVYFSGVYVREHNRPFPSHLVALFQNESSCKNEFDIHENESQGGTHFQKNGFALLTRAKTNSEMAHWVQLVTCHTLLACAYPCGVASHPGGVALL